MSTGRMAGRNCLIVGGTGGIGLTSARRFGAEGARVVVTGLTEAEASLAQASFKLVSALVCDVNDPASVEAAFDSALDRFGGRLDVLFHIAGISGRRFGDGPLHECSPDGWDAVLNANARGTFLTNRLAIRQMLAQERDSFGLRGTVLNTGSVLATSPSPGFFGTIAYAASKGAIRALTLASASAYAAEGVRFNLLSPGLIDTPMSNRAVNDPRIRTYLSTRQPLVDGPGKPDDCAEAALYLCEPASRFVTGVELTVDGGWCVSEGQVPSV